MKYKSETKQCQNCHKDFIIESDDFLFYEKIKVPPPTFCPRCRLQRRLSWMKGLNLFKRKCDLCGNLKFSMYSPSDPYVVYCSDCWWSDNWDPRDFAKDYDSNRNFFEQWNEFFHKTPVLGLSIDKISNRLSPYINHTGNAKNSFLIYYSDSVEDSAFGYEYTNVKNVYNSGTIMETENCYDSSHVYKSYNIICAVGNNRSCYDCFFIRDCEGCHHCFGLSSAKNKSYIFLGKQFSKEDYENKIKEINLGSYRGYNKWKEKCINYFKKVSPKPSWDTLSSDVSGSYVFNSKNCHECYDIIDCEDSKYLMLMKLGKVKDSYDYTDWGENAELIYESVTVGGQSQNVKFCYESGFGLSDIEYSVLSTGGSNHFGCVSMRKPEYCIFNRQYTKEEYKILREKIIEDMNKNPYINSSGHIYKYGEFFPPEFSPYAYNDTFVNRFFPIGEKSADKLNLKWNHQIINEYKVTFDPKDIPDDIKDVRESIVNEVIQCESCPKAFKVIPQELQFLKKNNLPISRKCPFCRIEEKIDIWVLNMTLFDRICCKCNKNFKTHYSKERAPMILCKECYKEEVY